MKPDLSIAELHDLFRLDRRTGQLFWRKRLHGGKTRLDRPAGYVEKGRGYVRIGVRDKNYWAHRLVFAMVHGYWAEQVDHRNGVKTDNSPRNLRDADRCQQRWNQGVKRDNTSGYKGVHRAGNKWHAQIIVRGVVLDLGTHNDVRKAAAAYARAARCHHKEFARLKNATPP
jgi:hypothetical protein